MRSFLAILVFCCALAAQAPPELVVSVGHSGAPTHAAFVGNYLATAEWSNVALIDLASGLAVAHLPQAALVMTIEGSPAGDLLAVATCNRAIQLWDVRSRAQVRRLGLAGECPEAISFNPDGTLLAAALYECNPQQNGLRVWDVRTGMLVRELAKGCGMRRVVFSGDGTWLAGVDDKRKASVFEWPSGRELRTFDGPGEFAEGPGFASRDGRFLGWVDRGDLRVWDVTSGAEIHAPGEQRDAETAAFLDDGRLAYADAERLTLMRLPDGPRQVISLPAVEMDVIGDLGIAKPHEWLRLRRDGRLLAGSRGLGTVLWDVSTARLRELTAPALSYPAALQWSRSGIVAWAGLGSGLRGWNDKVGKRAFGEEPDAATHFRFTADGSRVAAQGYLSAYVLDVARRRKIASREMPAALDSDIAISPDGSRLAMAEGDEFQLFDVSLRPLRRIDVLEKNTGVERAAFSPDGRWIAAGLGGPRTMLRVWTADGSGQPVTLDTERLTYGPQPPAFSADARRLASFRKGESLTIWATSSWSIERTLTLTGTGRALAFAPEGSRIAVASDGEAAVWDADTGRKAVIFSPPGSAQVIEIAWSPDGRRVVTAADDGVLRFWDSSNGTLLASLYMMDAGGEWLLVTPDGRVDGSGNALAHLVAWRAGDRAAIDAALTMQHRAAGLWSSLAGK